MSRKITLTVPSRLAGAVICRADCLYWLNAYHWRVRPDGQGLYIGRPVKGGEADGDTRMPTPRAFIGAAAVADGLRAMLQSGNVRHRECAARVLGGGEGDARDRDVVLQFAAYGAAHWD